MNFLRPWSCQRISPKTPLGFAGLQHAGFASQWFEKWLQKTQSRQKSNPLMTSLKPICSPWPQRRYSEQLGVQHLQTNTGWLNPCHNPLNASKKEETRGNKCLASSLHPTVMLIAQRETPWPAANKHVLLLRWKCVWSGSWGGNLQVYPIPLQ